MPYHLAIHKVVADVAPHQSPGRDEFHAQQSIHRGTISTKKKKEFGVRLTGLTREQTKHGLLSVPEEHHKAREGDRSVGGLQFGHQLPSLSSAIRARSVRPGFG